jgi:hypothetical protein
MRINNSFKYLFILSIVLIFSCNNDGLQTVEKPKNLISQEKLAEIISDIHLAESGLQLSNLSPDSLKRMTAGYYDFIFNKHQVKQSDFEMSYSYYLGNPPEMDSIYLKVIDGLNSKDSRSRGVLVEPSKP